VSLIVFYLTHSDFPLRVVNDALLLSAPLRLKRQTWGILVVAGTGSIVLGVTIDEASQECVQMCKRGGYGYLFGDVGSGYHLGLTGIRFCVEDFDLELEKPGGLAEACRKVYGVERTDEIPGEAVSHPISTVHTRSNGV
jgi:N-acetylglucosamine kinase-like BadF-type ATPase